MADEFVEVERGEFAENPDVFGGFVAGHGAPDEPAQVPA